MKMMSFLGGVAVGIAGMYLLDPDQGSVRRARVRDQAVRGSDRVRRAWKNTGMDSSGKPGHGRRDSSPARRIAISDPRQRWSDLEWIDAMRPVRSGLPSWTRSGMLDPRVLSGVIGVATLALAAQRFLASRPTPEAAAPGHDGSAPEYVHSPHQESHDF